MLRFCAIVFILQVLYTQYLYQTDYQVSCLSLETTWQQRV